METTNVNLSEKKFGVFFNTETKEKKFEWFDSDEDFVIYCEEFTHTDDHVRLAWKNVFLAILKNLINIIKNL